MTKIYILTGAVHSGKTSFLIKVVRELKKLGSKLDGFLSVAVQKRKEVIGYDLFDLSEESSTPLLRRKGAERRQKIGPYFFVPKGLAKAKKIILGSRDKELLIVDEVGPLELEGKGLWPALKQRLFLPSQKSLLVVRMSILEDFLKILGINKIKVFDIEGREIFPEIIKEMTEKVKKVY